MIMDYTRRDFLKTAGAGAAGLALAESASGGETKSHSRRHIVTLSFDDGMKKSSIKTAEIFEKHKLSACINIIATGHRKDFVPPDAYHRDPKGDFGLWNELKARGHEVMPHGYKHANKKNMPFAEAKGLIVRCLDVFDKELKGFNRKEAVFNFPYLASTPELDAWVPTQVLAFRTGYAGLNPWPHQGQARLTATSFGPGNAEAAVDREIEKLLAKETGWLIFCNHGLDNEGWGPIRAVYLERSWNGCWPSSP